MICHDRSNPNVTANRSLVTRLELNAKYSEFDFQRWVLDYLAIREGMDVLDVGCGNGAQTIEALGLTGPTGSVSALDISAESIAQLNRRLDNFPSLQVVVADMKNLSDVVKNEFRVKKYDLAYSVYALWYANDHIHILEAMRKTLKKNGRLVVCTPNYPNGLRELVKRLGTTLPHLDQINHFGPNVLEPYFRSFFYQVSVHMRKNVLRVPQVEEVLRFYRATAYYTPELEDAVARHVSVEIELSGHFKFEKNNYLIVGELPFAG